MLGAGPYDIGIGDWELDIHPANAGCAFHVEHGGEQKSPCDEARALRSTKNIPLGADQRYKRVASLYPAMAGRGSTRESKRCSLHHSYALPRRIIGRRP